MLKILGNTTQNLVTWELHPDDSNFVCMCVRAISTSWGRCTNIPKRNF